MTTGGAERRAVPKPAPIPSGDRPTYSSDEGRTLRDAVARKGSFAQTLKAVAWSFFGVRKASEYDKDVSQLNPVHVIVAGIVAGVVFVVALVLLVRWVIASGVAA